MTQTITCAKFVETLLKLQHQKVARFVGHQKNNLKKSSKLCARFMFFLCESREHTEQYRTAQKRTRENKTRERTGERERLKFNLVGWVKI